MPRNGSGVYTLPESPFVPGTVISSAAVNSDYSDIATALTGSIAADGQTPITAAIKFFSGTAALPGIAWASDPDSGFYYISANTFGFSCSGTLAGTFSTTGLALVGQIGAATGSISGNMSAGTYNTSVTIGTTGAVAVTGTAAGFTMTLNDNGATYGPVQTFYRNSSSPAANDLIGAQDFTGKDSGGNTTTYGAISAQILDPTDGSEDSRFYIQTLFAGSAQYWNVGAGVYAGTATGGDQGTGTINATAYYQNGVAYPGTLVPIENKTSSAVASYDFATGITSTYRSYIVKGWIQVATDDTELNFQTSTNGGVSYDSGAGNYDYQFSAVDPGGTNRGKSSTAATSILMASTDAGSGIGNASNEKFEFEIRFENPSSSAFYFMMFFSGAYQNTSSATISVTGGAGSRLTAADVDAFRLIPTAGNIAAGNVTLYGVKNS